MVRKTVAVMQPYVFPYAGYFSLVQASDVFVFYDDVHFRKGGWINRNRILINGAPYLFSIPLKNGSPNVLIKDVETRDAGRFREKFLKQLDLAYRKAPYFDQGMAYVEGVFASGGDHVSDLAIHSVKGLYALIGIERDFLLSSKAFAESRGMEKSDRLIAITKALGADSYVNAPGGQALYSKEYFKRQGVSLSFVRPVPLAGDMRGKDGDIEGGLSIIDAVMNNDAENLLRLIDSYELT